MSTSFATVNSGIPNTEPYKGDDWAQSLSRLLATPMFVMGLMGVFTALGLGIAGGVKIGDFFGALANPDLADLGRAQVLGQWAGAVAFLGMGFILGGIVMHLVNIVRTLRDAGRDVQTSLGAQPLKLRKPWTGHLTPHVMLMGVMAEVAAFVTGIVAAVKIGSLDAALLANPGSAISSDAADIGFAEAATIWLPGLRFAGLAILLSSVVLVLLTIQKTLRFQAARVTEIAQDAVQPSAPPAPGPGTDGGETFVRSVAGGNETVLDGWKPACPGLVSLAPVRFRRIHGHRRITSITSLRLQLRPTATERRWPVWVLGRPPV